MTSSSRRAKSWPVISGQQLGYTYLQLRDFKSGARKSDVMGPLTAALDRDEMMAFAGYFAKQPWPDLRQPRAPTAVAAQAATANTATGCTGCHRFNLRERRLRTLGIPK